jgi:hypothetical protein
MVNATGTMTSGIAEAMGGKEAGDKANKEIKQKQPEIDEKMKVMISDIRKDILHPNETKKRRDRTATF